jgi:hypothetical protein
MIGASVADHKAGAPDATAALATMLPNMRRLEILITTILPDATDTLHAVVTAFRQTEHPVSSGFSLPVSFIAAFGRLRKVFAAPARS